MGDNRMRLRCLYARYLAERRGRRCDVGGAC